MFSRGGQSLHSSGVSLLYDFHQNQNVMTNLNENSKYELPQKSTQLELTPFQADGSGVPRNFIQREFNKFS